MNRFGVLVGVLGVLVYDVFMLSPQSILAKTTIAAVVAMTSVACFPADCFGQDEQTMTPIGRRLVGLIQQLDDESWLVREQSMRMIGDPNEGFELDMLGAFIERAELSPEAMARFRSAARGLFEQTTKAGLGVGFGEVRDGGVEIGTVVAEVDRFPAAAMLMPGDLIVGADGSKLTTSEDLRAAILSHEPGETLDLLVRRGERVLEIEAPLGSYSSLRGAAPIGLEIADRAIAIRWARQGISVPGSQTIGGGIAPADWINAGYPEGSATVKKPGSRRMDRVVGLGSSRDVYVGIGVMRHSRIEPWVSRANAIEAMGQTRRIQITRSMDITRKQIEILQIGIKMLNTQIRKNGDNFKDNQPINLKIETATVELRSAQNELELLLVEFQSIATPAP